MRILRGIAQADGPKTAIKVMTCRKQLGIGARRKVSRGAGGGLGRDRMAELVDLPDGYMPTENEPFMNERQVEYFRRLLADWKTDLLAESRDTVGLMQKETRNIADIADLATQETDRAVLLRTRDRQRKLVGKIDAALRRIDQGEYGYCEETGRPISLKRLIARPVATLCLEAQERHERDERVFRDD